MVWQRMSQPRATWRFSPLRTVRSPILFGALIVFAICLVVPANAPAQITKTAADDFSAEEIEFFETKIRPIFAENCFKCHGDEEQEASLRLDSRETILAGGDTGPAIVPRSPETSLLMEVIGYQGKYQMPPDSKLPDDKIALLTQWVKMGAPWPKENKAVVASSKDFDLPTRKDNHWCWHPAVLPVMPDTSNKSWSKDPIDQFILARLEKEKLKPASDADKATIIRRAYFDLIGLPPSAEDVKRFLQDQTPTAFEKVVDELLASPRFGEHWARHWMDLTRYAETFGHEFDYPLEYANQYRDYLIRAFNEDVPYDQFLKEHLAGDLLPTPRYHPTRKINESILGTGFWFLGEATHGPVDVKGDEAGRIDNQIDVMSKTFLGLTVACARCHDHKFDAISTEDYYAFSGFLQSSRRQITWLDEGGVITDSLAKIALIRRESDEAFGRWLNEFKNLNADTLAAYLAEAIKLSRTRPASLQSSATLQGESLEFGKPGSGKIEKQRIEPRENFAWQNNEQLWWSDGKQGDKLEVFFNVDASNRFEVSIDFTKAQDYGIVKVWVDDEVGSAKTFDCFADRLTTSGKQSVGTFDLSKGRHRLCFEIVGANAAAIARQMFGLDYLVLEPIAQPDLFASWQSSIKSVAEEKKLAADNLKQLVDALQSAENDSPANPIFALKKMSHPGTGGMTVEELKNQVAATLPNDTPNDDSVVFADFESGDPKWYPSGWSFSCPPSTALVSSHDGMITSGDVLRSECLGPGSVGSIRSPSFEIGFDNVHYRLRGANVQIRLIVDGFTMDTFNALLFAGMTFDVPESPEFKWVTQGGDIRNYKGHRAYIEVNDLGGGWVELDKVVFSNGPAPSQKADNMNKEVLAAISKDTVEAIAESYASKIVERLQSGEPKAQVELLNWVRQFQLEPCLIGQDEMLPNSKSQINNDGRNFVGIEKANRNEASAVWLESRNTWLEKLTRVNEESAKLPGPARAIAMADGSPENEFVFIRGNHKTLGAQVTRRSLTALASESTPNYGNLAGSGRLDFANELTSSSHPLTSRVLVNRLWHHLFGRGIVNSVDNFGALGNKPTHPELLDYLSLEFSRNGWSIKQMIRRVVLTRTYGMASDVSPEAARIDPENHLLHSARIRRLSGEEIRDAILKVSGELDVKMYGPSVPVYLTSFMQGRGRPGSSGPLDGDRRRSVYLEIRRNFLNPMMLAFDTPIPFNAIGRRNVSNVPAQALILMNDPFVVDQAGKWAQRIVAEPGSTNEKVDRLLFSGLSRPATVDESRLCREFIEQQAKVRNIKADDQAQQIEIWRDLCHVVFNMKSFIFVH